MRLPIAIFVDRYIPGGTQRQLIELLRRIDRRRFRVHPVCFHDDGPWTVARGGTGRSDHTISDSRIRTAGTRPAAPAIRAVVPARTTSRSCIRGISIPTSSGCRARRWRACPCASAAVADSAVRRAVRRLQTLACRTAHRMVANSRAAASQLIAQGVPAAHIDIIPNGIDLSMFPVRHASSAATKDHHGRLPSGGEADRRAHRRGAADSRALSRCRVPDRR